MKFFDQEYYEETYYHCRCAEGWEKHTFSNHIKAIWIPTYQYGLNNCRD